MTIGDYLYSSMITILSTVLFVGYLSLYMKCRERKWMLMAVFFGLYLISELLRIIFSLASFSIEPSSDKISIVWNMIGFLIQIGYVSVIWEQSGKSFSIAEAVVLVLAASVGFFDRAAYIALCMIYFWAVYKLFSVKCSGKRTRWMFLAASVIGAYYFIFSITALLGPAKVEDFLLGEVSGRYFMDVPFYIMTIFSFADLNFYVVSSQRRRENISPDVTPVERIAAASGFTPREDEIFSLMVQGKSNREIGQTLFISEGTVKIHVHNILQKLGITNRRQINRLLLEQMEQK